MFDLYKPFRNRLGQYWVIQGLEVVYRFIQWLEYDRPLPRELNNIALPRGRMERIAKGIGPWEFELFARELILNADKWRGSRSLASYPEVARNINEIKRIENDTWPLHSKREKDILYELVRIAHRQFPWQRGFSAANISAYIRLYSDPMLADLFEREYGMPAADMIQLTLALAGHFLTDFTLTLPVTNQLNRVPVEVCNEFVDKFSMSLDEARRAVKGLQEYNINWAYTFNPLRSKPLIRINDKQVICPVTPFLIRRGTSEVYFDLVKHDDDFSRGYGPAFQRVVGAVAADASAGTPLRVLPEAHYGSRSKPRDSVDWIVEDDSASLFIECKGSRIKYRGISDLTNHEAIDAEFRRIRKFCFQLYKTLSDALAGLYPHWKPTGNPVYPIVVTMEDWETFGIKIAEEVINPLKRELAEISVDPDLVERYPPSFCSLQTLDQAIYVCGRRGVEEVFCRKVQGENQQWALDTYLGNAFSKVLAARAKMSLSTEWARIDGQRA